MLYDIGFFIFSILYLPTLIFKGKFHKGFLERFGVYNGAKKRILANAHAAIWIEAVSVGEVSLCKSFVPLLKERFPHNDIIISTVTKSGNDLARRLFGEVAAIIYFPLDFRLVVKRVARLTRPALYVMVETEIWPNLLAELKRLDAPCVLINGRISDASFGRYRMIRPFMKSALGCLDLFCMRSDLDAMRIIELGAAEAKVKVTGNMKFDMDITQPAAGGDSPKTPSGPEGNAQLFVAGSTHEGEEHILLDMYAGLLAKFANIRLLIAPRHVERAGRVETLARRRGFGTARISSLAGRKTPVPERTVLILDAVGHLAEAYSAATIVFVGGSLVEYGGHNLIEPAVFGKPVLFGPHMSNFRDMASAFIEAGGAIRVQDSRMLFEKVLFLLNNAGAREELGRKAREVVLKNRGATERNIGNINKLLKERGLAA